MKKLLKPGIVFLLIGILSSFTYHRLLSGSLNSTSTSTTYTGENWLVAIVFFTMSASTFIELRNVKEIITFKFQMFFIGFILSSLIICLITFYNNPFFYFMGAGYIIGAMTGFISGHIKQKFS